MLAKISEVRLQLEAVYADPIGNNIYRSVNEYIPLLERRAAAPVRRAARPPQAPTGITPTAWPTGDSIGMTWPASGDELGGQARCAELLRVPPSGWRGAVGHADLHGAAVPGTPTYDFEDKTVPLGQSYQYGVVARDCTPALSSLTGAGATVTPNP